MGEQKYEYSVFLQADLQMISELRKSSSKGGISQQIVTQRIEARILRDHGITIPHIPPLTTFFAAPKTTEKGSKTPFQAESDRDR